MKQEQVKDFQRTLLDWYDRHARDLPWRAKKGEKANPCHVWLSEIMLQQTTIATVRDYFLKFINRWPDVRSLAQADEDEILAAWSGLGYYSRARNLYKSALIIAHDYEGVVPRSYSDLMALPGIGDYTASAIRAIAYNAPSSVMDGNVERVVSRLFQIEGALPKAKPLFKEKVDVISKEVKDSANNVRYGDFAQAMMDLGSTICTPTSPKCILCPVQNMCLARQNAKPEDYPKKEPKKKKPVKYAKAYVVFDETGHFFMRKRQDKGMLAGMYEIPTSEWLVEKGNTKNEAFDDIDFTDINGVVRHVFTHFEFLISVCIAQIPQKEKKKFEGVWVTFDTWGNYGVPTVMKKIIYHALKNKV